MLEADIQRLAAQLARKHQIPKATVVHPAVVVPGDEFMTEKLRDPDYVPYCFGTDCGRTRRTVYGFRCPTCGNKMNYDLTHYNGNKNVQYTGPKPLPEDATAGMPMPGEWWRLRGRPPAEVAQRRMQHAEITAWNAQVDARKAAKKGRKP